MKTREDLFEDYPKIQRRLDEIRNNDNNNNNDNRSNTTNSHSQHNGINNTNINIDQLHKEVTSLRELTSVVKKAVDLSVMRLQMY